MKNIVSSTSITHESFLILSYVLCDFFLCNPVGLKRFLNGVDAPPFLAFNVLCNQRNTFFTLLAPLDFKSYRHLLVEPRIKNLALIKKRGLFWKNNCTCYADSFIAQHSVLLARCRTYIDAAKDRYPAKASWQPVGITLSAADLAMKMPLISRIFFPSKTTSIRFKSKCYHRSNISWQQLKIQFGPYSQVR